MCGSRDPHPKLGLGRAPCALATPLPRGAVSRTRTDDLVHGKHTSYQLDHHRVEARVGFEPTCGRFAGAFLTGLGHLAVALPLGFEPSMCGFGGRLRTGRCGERVVGRRGFEPLKD